MTTRTERTTPQSDAEAAMDQKVNRLAGFLKTTGVETGSDINGVRTAYLLTWEDGSAITINQKGADRIIIEGVCRDCCLSGRSGHRISLSIHRTSAAWASAIMEKLLPEYFKYWALCQEKEQQKKEDKKKAMAGIVRMNTIIGQARRNPEIGFYQGKVQILSAKGVFDLSIIQLTEDQACNLLEYIKNEPILQSILKGE
jgi:hypothetical protein